VEDREGKIVEMIPILVRCRLSRDLPALLVDNCQPFLCDVVVNDDMLEFPLRKALDALE
jgi:hypothetical protein